MRDIRDCSVEARRHFADLNNFLKTLGQFALATVKATLLPAVVKAMQWPCHGGGGGGVWICQPVNTSVGVP